MACEVSLIGYTEGELGLIPTTLNGFVDVETADEVTIDKIVDSIASTPTDTNETVSPRDQLISFINSLQYRPLSTADLKKHRFVSNTSIGELQKMYPDLAKLYPVNNPLPTSGVTMIRCNTCKVNGVDYNGRAIDKNGNEIFIIKGRKGAEAFFKYLLERETITTDANNANKVKKIVSEDLYNKLIAIKEHLQAKSLEDVFMTYLNDKGSKGLDTFEDPKLGVINARYTLGVSISLLTDRYNRDLLYSPLEQAIFQLSPAYDAKGKINHWEWSVDKRKLYSILDTYFKISNTYKEEEFKTLSVEELNKLFYGPQGYFFDHPRLYKSQIITKPKDITIKFTFPYSSLGTVYDFGYNETQKFFSPVLQEEEPKLDSDGRYKGFYVYKSVNEKMKSVFVVSRNPITSNSYSNTFSTLKATLIYVDHKVKYDPILKYCLYNLHDPAQINNENRVQDVQIGGIKANDIIAVSDFMLTKDTVTPVKYKNFPAAIQNLFEMSVLKFQNFFQEGFKNYEQQIKFFNKLKTAEQMGLFIMESYNTLMPSFKDTLSNAADLFKQPELIPKFEEITNRIVDSKTSLYVVESTKYKSQFNEKEESTPAILRALGYSCTSTDSGVITVNSPNTKLSQVIGKALVDAAAAISNEYGIEIVVEPEDSLKALPELQGLEFINNLSSIKGFVYNNKIYINQTRATQADLFHEMVHVFLGVLKAHDYNAYEKLINDYALKDHSFKQMLRSNRLKYKGLAEIDIMEEALADLMAAKWFNDNQLAKNFDINRYNDLMTGLLNKVDRAMSHIDPNENGLGFIQKGLKNSATLSRMRLHRKITNYLESKLKEGVIKETCN